MIIAQRKPLEDIEAMLTGYKKLLVLGCGTCVTICWAGGEKEVAILASQIRLASKKDGNEPLTLEATVERQCEKELVEALKGSVQQVDAVLSTACGAGVQTVAELFPDTPVYPALNTMFVGMPDREGVWLENCRTCGDCFLDRTGGICPIVRCAKGLLNGPCGGTNNGKCEVDPEKDCAWTLIYRRLDQQGRLDLMRKYYPPRNFQAVIRPGKIEALPA